MTVLAEIYMDAMDAYTKICDPEYWGAAADQCGYWEDKMHPYGTLYTCDRRVDYMRPATKSEAERALHSEWPHHIVTDRGQQAQWRR